MRQLRAEHLAGAGAAATQPERSEAWRAFKEKWFAAAYSCRGEECSERQPPDVAPGAYAFLGLATQYNSTRKFFDVAGKGTLLKYSSGLNPFIYGLAGEVGYRRYNSGESGPAGSARSDPSLGGTPRSASLPPPGGSRLAKSRFELTTSLFRTTTS